MDILPADIENIYLEGMEHLENEEYPEAIDKLKMAASKNHVRAQVELGILYTAGTGVQCSLKEAYGLFRSAAEQGDAEAQSYLGKMYLDGEGTEQSDKKAYKWISRASEQNEPYALNYLGYMYYEGRGTEKSTDKALECFISSAEQDNAEGAYNAGSVFLEKEDFVNAAKYFLIGSDNDDVQSMIELGKLIFEKKIEGTIEESKDLFQSAYEAGEPDGLYYLALIENSNENMLAEASSKGSTLAINALARIHKNEPDTIASYDSLYQDILKDDPEKESDYEEFKKIVSE